MTKTAAAKAFAETHGKWDSLNRLYTTRPATEVFAGAITADRAMDRAELRTERDLRKAVRDELKAVRKDRDELLTTVISILGLEDQYPTTTENNPAFSILSSYPTEPYITIPGARAFAADLRKAAGAISGQSALKRLRKAAKNAQKEQNS